MRFATFVLLATTVSFASAQTYTVHNNCTESLEVVVGLKRVQHTITVAKGATAELPGLGTEGTVWTYGNAGTYEGQPWKFRARAGFYSAPGDYWYYILRDPNPNNLNVGLSITPDKPFSNGFCRPAICASGDCTGVHTDDVPIYPPLTAVPATVPPKQPDYRCTDGTNYRITFCPTGKFPEAPGTQLNIKANSKKCLDVKGAVFADGTPVQIYDCNKTEEQKWIVKQGSTQVKVAGKDFCLDAGSNPGDGTKLKISKCDANAAGQKWYYTGTYVGDRQLKWAGAQGREYCLDLTKGDQTNSNVVQTWHCGEDLNPNQLWTTIN